MSKFNVKKARSKLRAAENEALRDEILLSEIDYTTKEILDDLESVTGWKKAHVARYTGYSISSIRNWYNRNENQVVMKCVCEFLKRRYWHDRNKERFAFDFEEEKENE